MTGPYALLRKLYTQVQARTMHSLGALLIIAFVAGVGAYSLIYSHAQSAYGSVQAASGSLASGAMKQSDSTASGGQSVKFSNVFNYGFDFSDSEPDSPTASPLQDTIAQYNNSSAVNSALSVLSKFSGSMMDVSIVGFGSQSNPEPSRNSYNLNSIASRLQLVQNVGGIPVITLIQAPSWMYTGCSEASINGVEDTNTTTPGVSDFSLPPCPSHYQDFAALAAEIAKSFPQVTYFVVWSEVRDFYNSGSKSYGAVAYTNLYNDVYSAIKAVRPDAQVGGPYAVMRATNTQLSGSVSDCPAGYASIPGNGTSWGYIDPEMQDVLCYWLSHNNGADFVAMDGPTEIAYASDASLTNPATASEKFSAVDTWLESLPAFKSHPLPIWWMESHIAPGDPNAGSLICGPGILPTASGCWSGAQGAAARIATILLMNTSGASVGLQWQPEEQQQAPTNIPDIPQIWPDEGLWTSTLSYNGSGGGQETTLASELLPLLSLIKQRLTLVSGQPSGVVAASGGNQLIVVNTNNTTVNTDADGISVALGPDAVLTKTVP